jgi:hypothetical protein
MCSHFQHFHIFTFFTFSAYTRIVTVLFNALICCSRFQHLHMFNIFHIFISSHFPRTHAVAYIWGSPFRLQLWGQLCALRLCGRVDLGRATCCQCVRVPPPMPRLPHLPPLFVRRVVTTAAAVAVQRRVILEMRFLRFVADILLDMRGGRTTLVSRRLGGQSSTDKPHSRSLRLASRRVRVAPAPDLLALATRFRRLATCSPSGT